jgi:hypothetical protein
MKESYRLSKPQISHEFAQNILIAFIYVDKEIKSYSKIERDIKDSINKLEKRIQLFQEKI